MASFSEILTSYVFAGFSMAKTMAKEMVTNPMLASENPTMAVPLEITAYAQQGQAEVSETPVIVTGTEVKQFLNDNVAPSPWTWQISGYIPGGATEVVNYFTPLVRYRVDQIRRAYKNGTLLTFKDMDCRIYKNVVIQALSIQYNSDCANKAPFTMTLKEIVELKSELSRFTLVEQAAAPDNESIDDGVTQTKQIGKENTYLWNGLGLERL